MLTQSPSRWYIDKTNATRETDNDLKQNQLFAFIRHTFFNILIPFHNKISEFRDHFASIDNL